MLNPNVRCAICRQLVGADQNGRIVYHTRAGYDSRRGIPTQEVCEGTNPAARP